MLLSSTYAFKAVFSVFRQELCAHTQNGGIPRCVRTQTLTRINKTGCFNKIRLLFLSAL